MRNSVCSFFFLLIVTASPGFCVENESMGSRKEVNEVFRNALIELAEQDQEIRRTLRSKFTMEQMQNDPAARDFALEMVRMDRVNQGKLEDLIDAHGFPDFRRVGEDGANAGFLVAQHSQDTRFRAKFLESAEKALADNAYSAQDYAMLVDRNRFFEGRPQLYGTQSDAQGRLLPVENPEGLKERRLKMGFPDD